MRDLLIVTDADACLPPAARIDLGITCAPGDAAPYDPAEHPARLREQQAPQPAAAAIEACTRAAAEVAPGGAVLYIGSGDGYSMEPTAAAQAAVAVAATRPGLTFLSHDSGSSLMGCGWQAIEAALATGDGPAAALQAAERARATARVFVMLEHPPFAGLGSGLANLRAVRAVVELAGSEIIALDRPTRRETALISLRDHLATAIRENDTVAGRLRLAIVHAGADVAADALATWAERSLGPEEVVVTSMTRHATTRLGPGAIALCWYRA